MISTLGDLHRWAHDVATGKLLSKAAQKQRTRFIPSDSRHARDGLQLERQSGWIGHTGSWPGYQTLMAYLPSQHATLVLLTNMNNGDGTLIPVAKAITKIITPKHVYEVVPYTEVPPPQSRMRGTRAVRLRAALERTRESRAAASELLL